VTTNSGSTHRLYPYQQKEGIDGSKEGKEKEEVSSEQF
jgi:hypothetical protein